MTCMLVLSGRMELMVMHGGVKDNYEHNVVVMNLPLCPQTAEFKFRSLNCLITKQATSAFSPLSHGLEKIQEIA